MTMTTKTLFLLSALTALAPTPALACIDTVTIDGPTPIYEGVNSDVVLLTLGSSDVVCLAAVMPAKHPANVRFIIFGRLAPVSSSCRARGGLPDGDLKIKGNFSGLG